jgi:predicted HNH restriction endonuclease
LKRKSIPTIGGNSSFKVNVLDGKGKVEFVLSTGNRRRISFESIEKVLARQKEKNSFITSDYRPAQNVSYHLALIKKYRKYEVLKNIPEGSKKPPRLNVTSEKIMRDQKVVNWALANADGKCECCNKRAPFIREKFNPYLEIHHVKQLADNGPDTPQNVVAVCPNCHKELHFGVNREKIISKIYKKIKRLER